MKLRSIVAAVTVLALEPSIVSAQPVGVVSFFTDVNDGRRPCAGLVLSGETLYGTTTDGPGSFWGGGTVFRVNIDGTGFTLLHRFDRLANTTPATNNDGAFPKAGLVLSGKTLYGTASSGGSSGHGTLFKVNTDGSNFAVLHSFKEGGTTGGTVFKIKSDGTGFTVLHSFTSIPLPPGLTN